MSSESRVTVVRLGPIEKHPNADTLSITQVHGGYPVILRSGEYAEGDLAAYVPVDSIVPEGDPRWEFLGVHRRIRAKKLRGTFSMGLLTKAAPEWVEGQDVTDELRIAKWSPEEPTEGSADEPDPGSMPVYTDIEGWRRWKGALVDGERVLMTEKIHGENFRAVHDGSRLWVGSRTRIKRDDSASKWWQAAHAAGLADKLARHPGIAVYGECHGYTGGFPYGSPARKPTLRIFDAIDTRTRKYLGVDAFRALDLDIPGAPILHEGPWSPDLAALAEGPSTLDASHVREGWVVRPWEERDDPRLGRVILKLHGQGFLLRGKD